MARSSSLFGMFLVMVIAFAAASTQAMGGSAANARLRRQLLAPTDLFPPGCNCERDASKSPYRLSLDSPATEDGLNKFCFTVNNVGGCDPRNKCCNGDQGVQKVEFEVESSCKGALKKATVDGVAKSVEYNTKTGVLRVTGLNKTADAAPGTQICLFLKPESSCPTLNQLCTVGGACKYAIFNQNRDCCPVDVVGAAPSPLPPSPQPPSPSVPLPGIVPGGRIPPPPPPGSFPHCNCVDSPEASRLSAYLDSVTEVGNLTRACFKVNVTSTCLLGSKCCEFDLNKLELEANPACSSSLVYTTLDGVKKPRFFQQNPYPMVKVTNIDKPFGSVNGTEICLFLRQPCNSLEQLCPGGSGKCTIALFNPQGSDPSCCPLSIV